MSAPGRDAAVTVSIEVAADPQTAFDVFTQHIDTWWLRGPAHRFAPRRDGCLRFEGGVAGRLLEEYADGSAFIIGRVLQWQPGELIVLTWRLPNFARDETTEVHVRFEPVGHATHVSVTHRGWSRLHPRHPARHGSAGPEFEMSKARLWGANLMALRAHIPLSTARQTT